MKPLSSELHYSKYWQSYFIAACSTSMNTRWFNFYFQLNINVETALAHQHWMKVILLKLFRRCFVNVETTSISIRRINFYFQPTFNVETTLVHRRWIDVILWMLFPCCFANVKTTSMKVRRLNSHFQPNHIDERWRSTLFQCWFKVDVFAGNLLIGTE